jgi:hypothetical protein
MEEWCGNSGKHPDYGYIFSERRALASVSPILLRLDVVERRQIIG